MEAFWYIAFLVAFTMVFTVAICHWRIAHGKKVSCGTMLAGAFSAAVCTLAFTMWLWGAELFSHDFWRHQKEAGSLSSLAPMLAMTAIPCILVALVVVAYYQAKGRRIQTDEKHVG
jgi:phosphatidylglycerophosphate synthase